MSASDRRTREYVTLANKRRPATALLVVTHLSPGGTREVLALIADELRTQGIGIVVTALYRGQNANVEGLPYEIMIDREQLAMRDYAIAFIRLASRIRALRPTAILSFLPAANILGALSGWIAGVSIRVATHHQPATTQNRLLSGVDRLLGSVGVYNHVVAVSDSIRKSFQQYPRSYRRRVLVIQNTIRPIAPRGNPLAVRHRFGLRGDAVLLVVIGRLSEEKNLFNTVAGASRVGGIQLVLVGDGPLRPELERFISKMHLEGKVLLLGQVERGVATEMLFAADIFVQLSTFEGRSLALLEAIYAQKAIVVSDIPPQREALTMADGRLAGLVCQPDNVDAIANALSAVVTNQNLRSELMARTTILKRDLDPVQMGRDYAAILTGRSSSAEGPVAT